MTSRPFPILKQHEGSWVVTTPSGKVYELFHETNARAIHKAGWRVETIGQYLARINQAERA